MNILSFVPGCIIVRQNYRRSLDSSHLGAKIFFLANEHNIMFMLVLATAPIRGHQVTPMVKTSDGHPGII